MALTLPEGRVRTLEEQLAQDGEIRLNSPFEIMRFTLVFNGSLPPAREGDERTRVARRDDKHRIRRAFHPQLRELWDTRLYLQRDLEAWSKVPKADRQAWEDVQDAKRASGLVRPMRVGPFTFVPLVTEYHALLCELDILFLRAEEPGKVISANGAGDLDNRLKVLFDALGVPRHPNQLPDNAQPSDTEDPFFCLLGDDKLVTAIRVESERLFHLPTGKLDHVELVVRVKVTTQRLGLANLGLLGSD